MDRNRHIISSVTWNTSFDKKEEAGELQQRISTWSQLKMQREIERVLSHLCPPGQVWQINELELDLGEIHYAELEQQLTLRLGSALSNTLSDLALNAAGNTDNNFVALNTIQSRLAALESFFVNGLLPWNFLPESASVNLLMEQQFQDKKDDTIAMIRRSGGASETARKRMALQLNENNLVRILKGLEPGNHKQVSSFSEDMIRVQQAKNVVKAGAKEFKRALWQWIMNYLLTEKGSLFNRIAFMKSSIRQMASHYNIAYSELLATIEAAIAGSETISGLRSDFIHTLQIISAENKQNKGRILPAPFQGANWLRLESWLKEDKKMPALSLKELNELIKGLYQEDRKGLGALLQRLAPQCLKALSSSLLSSASQKLLSNALQPGSGATISEGISLLERLAKRSNMALNSRALWQSAVELLLKGNTATFDSKHILQHCLVQISENEQLGQAELLTRLLRAETVQATRTTSAQIVYEELTAFFNSYNTSETALSLSTAIGGLLRDTVADLAPGARKIKLPASRETFIRLFRLDPKTGLETLMDFEDKKTLALALPYLLDRENALLLLRHCPKELGASIHSFIHYLKELLNILKPGFSTAVLETGLLQEGLLQIITKGGGLDPASLQRQLAARLSHYINKEHWEQVRAAASEAIYQQVQALNISGAPLKKNTGYYIQKWLQAKGLKEPAALAAFHALALRRLSRPEAPDLKSLLRLIKRSAVPKAGLARYLENYSRHPSFQKVLQEDGAYLKALSGYFVQETTHNKEQLLKSYLRVIHQAAPAKSILQIKQEFTALYWKCLLHCHAHEGKSGTLQTLLEKALWQQFQIPLPFLPGNKTIPEYSPSIQFNAGKEGEIHTEELVELISKGLQETLTNLHFRRRRYSLKWLIEASLHHHAELFGSILAGIQATEKRILWLQSLFTFSELTTLLKTGQSATFRQSADTLIFLHELAGIFARTEKAARLQYTCWETLWQFTASKKRPEKHAGKLAEDLLKQLAIEEGITTGMISGELEKRGLLLTPDLRTTLSRWLPALGSSVAGRIAEERSPTLSVSENTGLLNDLLRELVYTREVPVWAGNDAGTDAADLLNSSLRLYPIEFIQTLRNTHLTETQLTWLHEHLNLQHFLQASSRLKASAPFSAATLYAFYHTLGAFNIKGISPGALQYLVFKKLLQAMLSGNWRAISTRHIWSELLWDVCCTRGVLRKDFFAGINQSKQLLPPALKISWEQLIEQNTIQQHKKTATSPVEKNPALPLTIKSNTGMKIPVKNAGLVILNTYFQLLFDRLGLIGADKKFRHPDERHKAVHLLQFLCIGQTYTEEALLPLNKILCDVTLEEPIAPGIEITPEQQQLMKGLINAVIGYWPAIGSTSIEGFRGNWLLRAGTLQELGDRWELQVEKRVYDLLLQRSPFSFSIIMFPWMKKPIHVNWPH
jgi:hypothetical protein